MFFICNLDDRKLKVRRLFLVHFRGFTRSHLTTLLFISLVPEFLQPCRAVPCRAAPVATSTLSASHLAESVTLFAAIVFRHSAEMEAFLKILPTHAHSLASVVPQPGLIDLAQCGRSEVFRCDPGGVFLIYSRRERVILKKPQTKQNKQPVLGIT